MRTLNRQWRLTWISVDLSRTIDCGLYLSRDHAAGDVAAAQDDLLDDCADACDRSDIRAGHFRIEGPHGERETLRYMREA